MGEGRSKSRSRREVLLVGIEYEVRGTRKRNTMGYLWRGERTPWHCHAKVEPPNGVCYVATIRRLLSSERNGSWKVSTLISPS